MNRKNKNRIDRISDVYGDIERVWEVYEDVNCGKIRLSITKMWSSNEPGILHEKTYIYPPTFFEKLRGITHEMKYQFTKEKLQKGADYLNKLEILKKERYEEMERKLERWQNKYKRGLINMDDRNRWRVYERIEGDCIYVSIRTGGLIGRKLHTMVFGGRMDVGIRVYPPNIFERLVGITYKSKYLRAKRKMQMEADAHNRGIEKGVRFKKEVKKWMD